jgi:hypothetical protein
MIPRGNAPDEFVLQNREFPSKESLQATHSGKPILPRLNNIRARRSVEGKLLVVEHH